MKLSESRLEELNPFIWGRTKSSMEKIGFIVIAVIVVLAGGFVLMSQLNTPVPSAPAAKNTLSLSLSGLDSLSSGHYEGWAIFGEEKVSTGKFSIGDTLTFSGARDLTNADKIVITIEADGDNDVIPSGIVILAGSLAGSTASLNFPVDLSSSSGNYILATPTNDVAEGENTDETSGIWFITIPGPVAGLVLPDLGDGWVYEGWAVNQDTPLSTGRFLSSGVPDLFSGYSGPDSGPPFPGEDFLVNPPSGITFPIDLADGASKGVISVEPDLNGVDPTGAGPFQIKPLVGDIPSGALDHTNYQLGLNLVLPTGTATIS